MKTKIYARKYVGATGICKCCGTHAVLETDDVVHWHSEYISHTREIRKKLGKTYSVWFALCPTCGLSMKFSFAGDTSGTD